MKRNPLHIINGLLYIILAACHLTGCIIDDKEQMEEGSTDIVVRVASSYPSSGTKAEGAEIADDTPLVFKNGLLIFSDNTGEIVYVTTVVTGLSAGNLISIDDLTSPGGALVEGVPKAVTTVDFIGNPPAGITPPTEGEDINDFRSTAIEITTQSDNTGGVSNVSIYGTGTINRNTRPYGAHFTATAILSRIEIGKLVADGINIQSFDLAGIFISNFYPQAWLTGNTTLSTFTEYTPTSLFEEGGEYYYSQTYKTILYDYQPISPYLGKLTGYDYTPVTAGNRWTYNLFSGKMPRIVFRLKNVKATAAYIAANNNIDPFILRESWYITVIGFETGGVELNEIKPGEIYYLETIPVNPSTLDDGIWAEAKVNVMGWTDKDLSTGLPHFPW